MLPRDARRTSAPAKVAPVESPQILAPVRFARLKLAEFAYTPSKRAFVKLAWLRFAPTSVVWLETVAPVRLACVNKPPFRLPDKVTLVRFWPAKFQPV